jgi:hypothetical protein
VLRLVCVVAVLVALGRLPCAQAQEPPATGAASATMTWDIQRVDAPKWFEDMTSHSLRLDAAGHPHVAYGGDHLYYAWHDGSAWHTETVDNSPGVGGYASLALDAAGNPYISYQDDSNGDLKCAHWTGSNWAVETVDSDGYVGD